MNLRLRRLRRCEVDAETSGRVGRLGCLDGVLRPCRILFVAFIRAVYELAVITITKEGGSEDYRDEIDNLHYFLRSKNNIMS